MAGHYRGIPISASQPSGRSRYKVRPIQDRAANKRVLVSPATTNLDGELSVRWIRWGAEEFKGGARFKIIYKLIDAFLDLLDGFIREAKVNE